MESLGKHLLLSAISLLLTFMGLQTGRAESISKTAAQQTAARFAATKGMTITSSEPRLAPRRMPGAKQQPLYIFNIADNGGFVIVAGDDQATPVLGYSLQGSYDEASLPDNFRFWIEQTAAEIEAIGHSPLNIGQSPLNTHHAAIAPLIETKWNQGSSVEGGAIYNTMCPMIDGKRCLTGCVPTAGAQVMYYYQHPKEQTLTVPGYESAIAETANPLPPTTFKWDLMKKVYRYGDDNVSGDSIQAVSELMLYCGYAAMTSYGLDGSAASSWVMANNMAEYFDYDPYTLKSVSRITYTVGEWDALIYNEIQQGRPVICSGNSDTSGHAFICDGYDGEGFYHFNWGWGGSSNGYFTLQATNPNLSNPESVGYIFNQSAVIGLQPNTGIVPDNIPFEDEPETAAEPDGIVATASNLRVEGTSIIMGIYNHNEGTHAFGFGIAELKDDGTFTPIDTSYVFYNRYDLDTNWGFSSVTFNLSNYHLTTGNHLIVPLCQLKGESEWKRCKPARCYFSVDVADNGSMNIVAHPIKKIKVNRFEVVSPGIPYTPQRVIVSLTNEGDFYEEYATVYLGSTEYIGDYVAFRKVAINPGNTKEFELSVNKWDDKGNSLLEPGEYVLRLCPYNQTETVLASTIMTIACNLELTDIELRGNRLIQSVQPIVAKVKSTENDYTLPLYLFASQTDEMGPCVNIAGSAIEGGQTGDVIFHFAPKTEGEWNLWVATDEEGKNIIGHKTVSFGSLKVTSLEVTGCKVEQVKQSVAVAIDNPGGEYTGWFYLFASQTDEKGSRKSNKEVVLHPEGITTAELSFKPTSPGDWNLWLCSDWKGEDVWAQTVVHIDEAPEGKVTLQVDSTSLSFQGDTVFFSATLKNISDVPNYRELYAALSVVTAEGKTKIEGRYGEPFTIMPGETGETTMTFANIEEGKEYVLDYYYFGYCAKNIIWTLGSESFSLPHNETPQGDANGDGETNMNDILFIINLINGNGNGDGDVNGDGVVDISDIITIISSMTKEIP